MKLIAMTTAGVIATALASPASAQNTNSATQSPPTSTAEPADKGGVEDVIVTATRTGETRAQQTPLSIAVFSSERLTGAMVNNMKDLVSLIPNVSVSQTTANAQIYVRGIGSNNVNAGSDPDVTVQVDGVYLGRPYAQFADFIDVDRVEVLRGPQGTLYGRNAVGGTINVVSRKPSDTFAAKMMLTGGTYDLFQAQGYVSGPIVEDKIQAGITGNYYRHDPYEKNIVPGGRDINNANRGGVRFQLRITPTDSLEFITRADYNKTDEDYEAFSHTLAPIGYTPLANSILGDYSKVAVNDPQHLSSEIWGVSQEINWRVSSALSFKSLTAYRRQAFTAVSDNDSTEVAVNRNTQNDVARDFSQEFDINLNVHRLDAVFGAYYFHENEPFYNEAFSPPSAGTTAPRSGVTQVNAYAQVRSKAVFAQGTFHLTDTLGLTAGLRYTHDEKTLNQNYARLSLNPATPNLVLASFVGTSAPTFHAFTPKFGIDWKVRPSVMLYVSATRGYKSGGVNSAASNLVSLNFGPESIWSFEGGIKSEWLDHHLRFNATLFRYNYKNLQVQSLLGPGIIAIGNAASSRVQGLELETIAKPVHNLTLTANLAFLDAKYLSFPQASVAAALVPFVTGSPNYNPATTTYDASGNRLNLAPKFSMTTSAEYSVPVGAGSVFLRGDLFHQSRAFYDATNVPIMSQKAYELVNLSAGFRRGSSFGIQVVAKNVTQTRYLFAFAANSVVPTGHAGDPRTFAIQLTKGW